MIHSSKRFETTDRLPWFKTLRRALALATGFALLPIYAEAQLQDAQFTVGTSAVDAADQDWAFLLFQLTVSGDELLDRRLAVYSKPGDIDSPGVFSHSGNVALQVEPLVIKALLNRATAIGNAPNDLNSAIDELFGELVAAPDLAVEEKLSAVIRGSIGDPRQYANLMLLARMHPGVSLCLGLAHAQRIGLGKTTFEVRELGTLGEDLGVIGRVVVEAGKPVVLPAPGAPVAVPDTSPKGHLNARLRWATPDELRRLALLQYGFNVYRVTRNIAEIAGWDIDPPELEVLADLAVTDPGVKRINRSPVLPVALYDGVEVLDLASDPKTVFIADDNGLSDPEPVRFKDGERFYYFVTARDVLGRDGFVSMGTQVMMSDRVPPHSPRRPEVTNQVVFVDGQETHHLKVTWRQIEQTPEQTISGYYVYRWGDPGDVQRHGLSMTHNRISAFIPAVPGQTHLSYVDDGLGSPTVPDDFDMTYWYTVRAVKQTALGGNFSPNSAPAFGVLRNRFAPEAPVGQILINCCLPEALPDRIESLTDAAADDPLRAILDLVAERNSIAITWAEFALNDTRDPAAFLGRFHYNFLHASVRHRLDLGRRLVVDQTLVIYCRVGDANGNASPWVSIEERGLPLVGEVRRYIFQGFESCEEVALDAAAEAAGCDGHSPGGLELFGNLIIPQDGENPVKPIRLKVPLTDRAEEYRVYRRVDQGQINLWKQGLADEAEANEIVLEDGALPPNAGEVSYFGQLLDDNGNASELKLLGTHVAVKQPAPVALLGMPELDGNDTDPRIKIRWFCPPHGVDRFEVLLGVSPGPIPNSISPDLSTNQNSVQKKIQFTVDSGAGEDDQVPHGVYRTPAIDGGFGPGPDYEISIPINKAATYQIQIRTLAKHGGAYRHSNAHTFKWPSDGFPEATGPMVPWPARTPPSIQQDAHPEIVPMQVNYDGFNGLGVIIGAVPNEAVAGEGNLTGSDADIRDFLFPVEGETSGKLFPMMLYRYQVASATYPNPSGDLIQVSPLMTDIATVATAASTEIRDPFIKIVFPGSGGLDKPWPIVLLDTQPAVRTASYAYVIVRFRTDGEIASVHPVPAILVQ